MPKAMIRISIRLTRTVFVTDSLGIDIERNRDDMTVSNHLNFLGGGLNGISIKEPYSS